MGGQPPGGVGDERAGEEAGAARQHRRSEVVGVRGPVFHQALLRPPGGEQRDRQPVVVRQLAHQRLEPRLHLVAGHAAQRHRAAAVARRHGVEIGGRPGRRVVGVAQHQHRIGDGARGGHGVDGLVQFARQHQQVHDAVLRADALHGEQFAVACRGQGREQVVRAGRHADAQRPFPQAGARPAQREPDRPGHAIGGQQPRKPLAIQLRHRARDRHGGRAARCKARPPRRQRRHDAIAHRRPVHHLRDAAGTGQRHRNGVARARLVQRLFEPAGVAVALQQRLQFKRRGAGHHQPLREPCVVEARHRRAEVIVLHVKPPAVTSLPRLRVAASPQATHGGGERLRGSGVHWKTEAWPRRG